MNQRIRFYIKTPPNTEKLGRLSAGYFFGSLFFTLLSLLVGLLTHQTSRKTENLQFWASLSFFASSMTIIAAASQLSREYQFKAQKDSQGVLFPKKITVPFLAAITSTIGTALILTVESNSMLNGLWLVLLDLASATWSIFLIVLAIISTRSYTLLSEDGVKVHAPFQSDKSTSWDDCPAPHMLHPQIVALTIDGKDVYASTSGDPVDPRIMAALINYYRTHPEHRHELTTGETIERLKTGNLPIDWTLTPQPPAPPEQEP